MGKRFIRGIVAFTAMLILSTSSIQAAPTPHGGKSFLWKIPTNAGTVFLFGSMHLARSDSYPLPPLVEESFAQADIVALEADPGKAMAEETQQRLVHSALYAGNDSLRQHVSNETYNLASREMKRLGLTIEQFTRSKPWFLAMTIDVLQLQQLGYSPEHGMDLYFAGKARGKKKIVELESFDYQINLLNSLSEREQELFLLYTIKEQTAVREEMEELTQAWRTGNIRTLERLLEKATSEVPETRPIYEKLYTERNRKMTGKIEQFLRTGESCFVIVGAAHLVGPEGIVELLKRKGYKVEQL